MDYMTITRTILTIFFITFGPASLNPLEAYGGEISDLIKNIFICVPKMNESLMGLEQHEDE